MRWPGNIERSIVSEFGRVLVQVSLWVWTMRTSKNHEPSSCSCFQTSEARSKDLHNKLSEVGMKHRSLVRPSVGRGPAISRSAHLLNSNSFFVTTSKAPLTTSVSLVTSRHLQSILLGCLVFPFETIERDRKRLPAPACGRSPKQPGAALRTWAKLERISLLLWAELVVASWVKTRSETWGDQKRDVIGFGKGERERERERKRGTIKCAWVWTLNLLFKRLRQTQNGSEWGCTFI